MINVYFKKYFLLAISFCFFSTIACDIEMRNGQDMVVCEDDKDIKVDITNKYLDVLTNKKITPENTIFAFDIHEVLFDRNKSIIIWGAAKLLCKSFLYFLLHPSLIMRFIQISREYTIFEGMYAKIIKEHSYWARFKPDFFEISNSSCYPIEPMIQLLKNLKEKGFKVFMLSNMGSETWDDFGKRFKSIVELFDGFYTPNKESNYIGKPSLEFYEGFKNYLRTMGYGDKQIVFIDDIEKNIVGAANAGIAGIHFTDYEKLCKTLRDLNLTIDNPKVPIFEV